MNAGREGVEARPDGQSLFAGGLQAGSLMASQFGLSSYHW